MRGKGSEIKGGGNQKKWQSGRFIILGCSLVAAEGLDGEKAKAQASTKEPRQSLWYIPTTGKTCWQAEDNARGRIGVDVNKIEECEEPKPQVAA